MKDIIVFDIGGTWFRSGIYTTKGKLALVSKRSAINFLNTQHDSVKELQDKFLVYLQEEVKRLRSVFPKETIDHIGISMGAALNSHTGYIFNSGPLWGPKCVPFDLKEKLEKIFPNMNISVVNDVSAALLGEVNYGKNDKFSKVMLITISSGIACRIIDLPAKTIPVDRKFGLQGEIGHLPITFIYKKKILELVCDCGGKNHLNAFSSGRGIERIIKLILGKKMTLDKFIKLVKRNNRIALEILHIVTKPLADILLTSFTLDPQIEKVILTGGVVHAFPKKYLQAILDHLNYMGMYQITERDPNFFSKRIHIGRDDDMSCLIGAALSF